MPFKLTKQELAEKAKHITALVDARSEIDAAVEKYNEAMQTERETLEKQLEHYEEVLAEAKGWTDDIVNQANDDFAEKSERWQEGDTGTATTEWINEWEAALSDEVTIEFPDELTVDWEIHADELEALPDAPNS